MIIKILLNYIIVKKISIIKLIFIFLSIFINFFSDYLSEIIIYILNEKKISVIIPIYNTEKYLVECLNSVINQTLKNIEIICIDDGSTDNSSNILQIYNESDERFVLLKQKNRGAAASRNKGIEISRGKFISFLDSDDKYYDNFALEFLYKKAKNNIAIISGGGMEIREEKNNQTFSGNLIFNHEGFISYKDYQFDFFYQRFIYKKKFLKKYKLHFPNFVRYQDPPFFIKTMFLAKKFYATKKITNIYRSKLKINFNLKQVIDIFSGINECLEMTKKLKLYKLYRTILERLKSETYLNISKKFFNNTSVKKILYNIQKNNHVNVYNFL